MKNHNFVVETAWSAFTLKPKCVWRSKVAHVLTNHAMKAYIGSA
jgi:hypothetical protein